MQSLATTPSPSRPDASSLLSLAQRSTRLRSKAGLRQWLKNEVQDFIPHAFMVIAWGDLSTAFLSHEVISADPWLEAALHRQVTSHIRPMFGRWMDSERMPVALPTDELLMSSHSWPMDARHVLAHGMSDRRGSYDCLYAFFGPEALCGAKSKEASRVLLPFIDAGFRQLTFTVDPEDSVDSLASFMLPRGPAAVVPQIDVGKAQDLSAREVEVMQWVRMGKTNSEIASILNLSTFTVKNHMRRIYKKLDVLNRAQAVGCMKRADAVR
jgi:transcriptional regulator EpsA